MEKKKIVLTEKEWKESKYSTHEWEQSVNVFRWEHNFETQMYSIEYNEK